MELRRVALTPSSSDFVTTSRPGGRLMAPPPVEASGQSVDITAMAPPAPPRCPAGRPLPWNTEP